MLKLVPRWWTRMSPPSLTPWALYLWTHCASPEVAKDKIWLTFTGWVILVLRNLQHVLCYRCSLVGMNVRQRSVQFVPTSLRLSTCLRHTCLSSSKGLQLCILLFPLFWKGYIGSLNGGITGSKNLESFDSEDSSSIQNSKQRCGIAFDILSWMLGTVLGASLDPFHSDGCYTTRQKIMWEF